jgi:hypothetical protein
MLVDTCPQCSSKMGAPLKSGRQVCAKCGWSSGPAKAPAASTKSASAQTGLGGLIQKLLRIVGRTIGYGFASAQRWFSQLVESGKQRRSQPGKFMQSLNQRLANLEEAIPTNPDAPRWMTPEAAFKFLGGDPTNLRSEISNRKGNRTIKFNNFKALTSADDFLDFGLEYSQERREANKPCLRWRSPS